MIDKEKVIKGMEQFRADLKPFCGNHADWERFDAGLSMLKEQKNTLNLLCSTMEDMVRGNASEEVSYLLRLMGKWEKERIAKQ